MIYQFCRLFYRFGLRLTLILAPWRSQPRHDVATPIQIRQAAAIPKTSGPPWLPLLAQSLPVYLPASCRVCACLAAVEVRQGRRPLLLGLQRRPRPVGASSAAAAPCALWHRQTPPSGPQESSLRHEVPSRVYLNTQEVIPASDTAPGSRRRPIPDARSQTVLWFVVVLACRFAHSLVLSRWASPSSSNRHSRNCTWRPRLSRTT